MAKSSDTLNLTQPSFYGGYWFKDQGEVTQLC